MKPLPYQEKFFLVIALLPLLLLHACASAKFSAGDPKNSLPLPEKGLIEKVHSVSVAPFFGDNDHWRETTVKALSAPGLIVVKTGGQELSSLGPDDRREALVKLAKSAGTDAVLNGVLLSRQGRSELILQLIASGDSRLLFWQAADFVHEDGRIDPAVQARLLSKMLGPLLSNIASRERPPVQAPHIVKQPAVETPPRVDTNPETGPQPKVEKKTRSDRRHEKGRRPSSENISPM